jgi:PTS family porter component IIA
MLGQYISPGGIMLQEVCRDWEECIDRGVRPLLEHGIVLPSYPAAVKRNHREMGAYMVIAPGIMLSHARPEDGAEAVGLTILTLREPVAFGSAHNDPVRLVITLATPDAKSHVAMLEDLSAFLMTEGMAQRLMEAQTEESAQALFEEYQEGVS